MIRTLDIDDFVAAPAGRYVAGEHFLYASHSDALFALFVWGRPDAEETRRLIRALHAEVTPHARPHRTLADFSEVTGIDSEAFAALRDFLEQVKERQCAVTLQEALIRPAGLAGTVVAGYYLLYPPPYPVKVFTDSREALTWLGLEAPVLGGWCELRDAVRAQSPELAALRALLRSQMAEATLRSSAKHLGVSSRTLQRQLKNGGTTFQRQLDAARLEAARGLLADSSEKLAAIARLVGFSSPHHFSDWFHRQAGLTAERWRATHQAPPPPTPPTALPR